MARWELKDCGPELKKKIEASESGLVKVPTRTDLKDTFQPVEGMTVGLLKVTKTGTMIGVDPGTHTGIAIRTEGEFKSIRTTTIIEAIELVCKLHRAYEGKIFVRIEDARLRTFFGKTGPEKWKGAGSIMRDCTIWETEMKRQGINFEMVHPKNVKATTAKQFEALTGWKDRTSIHAREAAWMIL